MFKYLIVICEFEIIYIKIIFFDVKFMIVLIMYYEG